MSKTPVCDRSSYLPDDMTADNLWRWDELIGLLEDECVRVCNSVRAEHGRVWKDPNLLHSINLRDAVLAEYDLIDQYNLIGQDLFDKWLPAIVKGMMESNRPSYGCM